ncbi:conserved protein of unknown function [Limnospira indica PCC 8005]|uniref:Uncharacterized protein n=1 Tax=Limnospira indica PCC 8005 TaxID=376219 RepID=A0A9P1KFD8_9CYAN|nr:conserved protein of unknown function [Limnospira indica PCC 8005]
MSVFISARHNLMETINCPSDTYRLTSDPESGEEFNYCLTRYDPQRPIPINNPSTR